MKLKITKQDRQALKKVFKNFGRKKTDEEIFYDLCFCILAPQTTFKANTKVINDLKDYDFYNINPLAIKLAEIHDMVRPARFYRNKTKYLFEAKKKFPEILKYVTRKRGVPIKQNREGKIYSVCYWDIRDWLVKNVKGLGMKASSHFLRNLGDTKLAIIDVHIIKFLVEYNAFCITNAKKDKILRLEQYKKMATDRKGYEILESFFQEIARKYKVTVAELDAYVWKKYSGTPWEDFKF